MKRETTFTTCRATDVEEGDVIIHRRLGRWVEVLDVWRTLEDLEKSFGRQEPRENVIGRELLDYSASRPDVALLATAFTGDYFLGEFVVIRWLNVKAATLFEFGDCFHVFARDDLVQVQVRGGRGLIKGMTP